MQVLMRRGTVGPHGLACEVGEIVDLPDAVARHWVAIGRAELVESTPVPMVQRDPVAQVAEPPKRKRR